MVSGKLSEQVSTNEYVQVRIRLIDTYFYEYQRRLTQTIIPIGTWTILLKSDFFRFHAAEPRRRWWQIKVGHARTQHLKIEQVLRGETREIRTTTRPNQCTRICVRVYKTNTFSRTSVQFENAKTSVG